MAHAAISRRSPYTGGMLRTGIPLIVAFAFAFTLAGCGMKGDLYLPPEEPAADVAAPLAEDAPPADKGERRTIPPTPDPSLSR